MKKTARMSLFRFSLNKTLISFFLILLGFVFGSASASEKALGQSMPFASKPSSGKTTNLTGIDGDVLGLQPVRISSVLRKVDGELSLHFRGAKEIKIFKEFSPAVVLILSNDGIGSGVILNEQGEILTNWHVVAEHKNVGVVFKPRQRGAKPDPSKYILADVVKVDEVSDLALIRLKTLPRTLKTIELGSEDEVEVGADVHAIGHPTGESWTYTKGTISQFRLKYDWVTAKGVKHNADVVQTQTPINPGNSGGPLISDNATLIGINAFKADGEALNFSVAISEIRRVLASEEIYRVAAEAVNPAENCEVQSLSVGRSPDEKEEVVELDINCDGSVDALVVVPDDPNEGIQFIMDKDRGCPS